MLIFTGYAALLLRREPAIVLQERRLKAKKPTSLIAFLRRWRSSIGSGYRSLLLGFPFHDARPDYRVGGRHHRADDGARSFS